MGSIGLPEIFVVALILVVLAAPVVVLLWLVRRMSKTAAVPGSGPPPGLVPCKACGRAISPRAAACPQCGEPQVTG